MRPKKSELFSNVIEIFRTVGTDVAAIKSVASNVNVCLSFVSSG